MSVLQIGLAIADLGIARMWPCSAMTGPNLFCGATPCSKYLRRCGVESHARAIWLCPVHAALVAGGGSICKECAARGGITGIVKIIRLSEPLRI
jgi:hypothetical protein